MASREPSGAQSGAVSSVSGGVMSTRFPPSSSIVHTWFGKLVASVKAIVPPSGDQAGSASTAAVTARACGSLPSASMTQMSPWRTNAMRVPSGDHVGSLPPRVPWVRRVRPVPSAFRTNTWLPRSAVVRVNASCSPDGDQDASLSSTRWFVNVRRVIGPPGAAMPRS